MTKPQQQTAVKLYGVFASHWESLACAPEQQLHQVLARDSRDLVQPFMQAGTYPARHFATLRGL